MSDVGKRDLPAELRGEITGSNWRRMWGSAGRGSMSESSIPWEIERQELGRSRNEPGDGFRYVVRAGTSGVGGRAEWFEVTEVFEGVKARDIEAFMRIRNNIATRQALDPGAFLNGLDVGTPGRAAQRRAADRMWSTPVWSPKKGDLTVPELVEELIKDNLAKLEAEAEAVRGPKKPKAVRVATKG